MASKRVGSIRVQLGLRIAVPGASLNTGSRCVFHTSRILFMNVTATSVEAAIRRIAGIFGRRVTVRRTNVWRCRTQSTAGTIPHKLLSCRCVLLMCMWLQSCLARMLCRELRRVGVARVRTASLGSCHGRHRHTTSPTCTSIWYPGVLGN